MRIVMTAMSDIVRDARVQREARTLVGAGHDVTVYGLRPPDADEFDLPSDLDVRWVGGASPFPRGRKPRRLARVFRAGRWVMLPTHIRSLERSFAEAVLGDLSGERVDVVHAHDFDTLELGADLADRAGAALVYDSHEAWSERRRPGRPTPLTDRRTAVRERELGARADAIVTVSPTLGRWLQERHGWSEVTIIRNTFPPLEGPQQPLPDRPAGILYAGRIGAGRDLETLLSAAPSLPDLQAVLVGPADPTFLRDTGGVRVLPPVAVDGVDALLRRWGLGLVAMSAGPLNHEVALPNKLFQSVRAGVPVVAVDLPELRRVVTEHGLGTLYRPGDPEDLVRAVREAQDRYEELTASVAAARHALSWAVDSDELRRLYKRLT